MFCRFLAIWIAVMASGGAASALVKCYGGEQGASQTRFRLEGGEALDTKTGLIWQRCTHSLTWSGNACSGELVYLTLTEALAAAKTAGWRVPSGSELHSLIDTGCGSPVVNTLVFPDIRPTEEGLAKYWTREPTGMLELFYNFDFLTGQADGNSRGIALSVRLVRGP